MVTIEDILKKNNLNLDLKEELLSFVLDDEYIFKEMYLESAHHYDCPCDKKYIKAFFFVNKMCKENIILYPEMKYGALWVSKDLSYFDEVGECYTTLEI